MYRLTDTGGVTPCVSTRYSVTCPDATGHTPITKPAKPPIIRLRHLASRIAYAAIHPAANPQPIHKIALIFTNPM